MSYYPSKLNALNLIVPGGRSPVIPLFGRTVYVPPLAYVGAGDIVSGATFWGGLRAYSAATVGNKAINLRASGDNATSDFITLGNGNLDVASISTFQTAHGGSLFVTKLYDQTGNGNDLAQATAGNQPSFTLAGLGALPIISCSGAANQGLVGPSTFTDVNPATIVAVGNHTAGTVQANLLAAVASTQQLGYRTSANNQAFTFCSPSVLTATASDGNWHVLQAIFNGASGSINVDATQTTGATGTNAGAGNAMTFGDSGSLAQPFNGSFFEGGYWPFGPATFTAGILSAMNSNIHTYCGF